MVKTISGKEVARKDCRKIRGEFYLLGDNTKEDSGDCYKINGRYYKAHTGYIIYDHRLKTYVIKKMNVIVEKGVIGLDEKEQPIFGAFSLDMENPEPPLVNIGGRQYNCLSEDFLVSSFSYQEDLRTGIFVERTTVPAVNFFQPQKVRPETKQNLPYDSTGRTGIVEDKYNTMYKPELSKALKIHGDIAHGLTFGVEFETTKGYIPQRITDRLGLMALRDGSIPGLEYVTIPLKGEKGIQALVDSLGELQKRTTYDDSCSLHIHIGGMPRTEEFLLAFMRVVYLIQDEMFGLFPFYKKENYGVKRKAYTKPYAYEDTVYQFDRMITPENIKSNFDRFYQFLSMGQDYGSVGYDLKNVKCHPSDPNGTSKWNIRSRYYWVNMIPLLFGNKQTVEFRLHTPTYDTYKVINYLALCASIVNYTIKHTKQILEQPQRYTGMRIDTIIADQYYDRPNGSRVADSLIDYVSRRRNHFYNCMKQGNIKGDEATMLFRNHIDWKSLISSEYKGKDILRATYSSHGLAQAIADLEDAIPPIGEPRFIIGNARRVGRNRGNVEPVPQEVVEQILNEEVEDFDFEDEIREL